MAEKIGPTVPTIHDHTKHTNVLREVYVDAAGMTIPIAGSIAPLDDLYGREFAAVGPKRTRCWFTLPKGFVPGNVKLYLIWTNTLLDFGTVVEWYASLHGFNYNLVDVQLAVDNSVTVAGLTATLKRRTEIISIDASAMLEGELVTVNVSRQVDGLIDTFPHSVYLIGILLEYTSNE